VSAKTESIWPRIGTVAGSCEHNAEAPYWAGNLPSWGDYFVIILVSPLNQLVNVNSVISSMLGRFVLPKTLSKHTYHSGTVQKTTGHRLMCDEQDSGKSKKRVRCQVGIIIHRFKN
jgi:hypothetical protein